MKTFVVLVTSITVTLIIICALIFSTKSCTMRRKHTQSMLYGLDRIASVYDVNGKLIKSYDGKIRIEQDNGNETKFLVGNRSVYVNGGIVIIEESE